MSKEEIEGELNEALREEERTSLQVKHAREVTRLREKAESADRKVKHLLEEVERAENELRTALAIKADFAPARIVAPKASGGKTPATAVILASDWHVGERIDKKTVNGLNEFNPKIAERRMHNYFRNAVKLVRKERQDVTIDNLVLWLGGDFISNTIHPELLEMNYMSPTEETRFAQTHIAAGLKYLGENGDFKKITVVCSTGNHGRTTEKRRVSSEYRNSHEHFMYWNLAERFSDKLFDWQIPDSYFAYVSIYGQLYRFHHGHNIRYQGGVGGVSIPALKYVARANQQRAAVHDFFGHYHQLFRHGLFTINGSLVGFDAYALSIGASPERPQQALQIIDAKHGLTIAAPILLEM